MHLPEPHSFSCYRFHLVWGKKHTALKCVLHSMNCFRLGVKAICLSWIKPFHATRLQFVQPSSGTYWNVQMSLWIFFLLQWIRSKLMGPIKSTLVESLNWVSPSCFFPRCLLRFFYLFHQSHFELSLLFRYEVYTRQNQNPWQHLEVKWIWSAADRVQHWMKTLSDMVSNPLWHSRL